MNGQDAAMCCCICDTTEDLRVCPIMTGDRFGQPPKYPVCTACFHAWHDGGGRTREEIRRYRGLDRPPRVGLVRALDGEAVARV